ncbi:Uncharacterised protein [Salmonella enterica subsp. enterica serovar Bovismorbificans]|uniref:Uncharacterized protein n=1 Tax=Salmonella enterica subsp. enterica serovar Bovismorbificans TaxID=58097 RepID=A0A655CBZ2_SALET|nr:Uncharacterised protein [Salmonella enterica subsp. enterica serovar Bovismorbificans]
MISSAFSASRSKASCSVPVEVSPKVGAACPNWEVEKKTGRIASKSRSSTMRCMRTEPTIPRQPIKPTFFIAFFSCKEMCCVCAPVSCGASFTIQKAAKVASEINQ